MRRRTACRTLANCGIVVPSLPDLTAWQIAAMDGSELPASYQRPLAALPHGPSIFKVDYELDQPIPWRAAACRQAGTVQLYLMRRERRRESASLGLTAIFRKITRQTAQRNSRNRSKDLRRAFGRIVRVRRSSNPAQLEHSNANLVGGHISSGSSRLWRLLARPTVRAKPYRTAAKGIYIRSSSTPRGPGVHGMCGFYAAPSLLSREL